MTGRPRSSASAAPSWRSSWRRHLRLLRRYGPAVTYDAVLTGFLICGHLWTDQPGERDGPWQWWTRRAEILIPPGAESSQFSASRIFAAAYPEAVGLASLIASPAWRSLAVGDPAQQQQFTAAIGQRLGRPGYQPADTSDPIAHWIKYDSCQPPSRPHTTFPQTCRYRSSPSPCGQHEQAEPHSSGTNVAPCGFRATAAAAASSCTMATSGPF